jgi:pantoate--beta-alanine ligase
MRELERESTTTDTARLRCAIVGAGLLGHAIVASLRDGGLAVDGPLGRGARCPQADVVLLCVPDGEIAAAAAAIQPGPLVGHCSGATTLDPLAPHEAFSLHPLMTVAAEGPSRFAGASAATAGTTDRARATATALALQLGMTPIAVADEDRAAYHAAASIASNFLLTLEAAAEQLAATAGVDRQALVPLVRASVENWATLGPSRALTGPLARGDEATVQRQRQAVQERTPHLLPLFDTLAEATRRLANGADRAGGRNPGMRTIRTTEELRTELTPAKRAGRTIGLVPTMGALHAGHRSLIEQARKHCDVVVVSLFVNPTQFAPEEDLAAYPRDEARDAQIAAAAGAAVLFAPSVEQVYPPGFQTTVRVGALADPLEGAQRPGHFDGVATVVTKLLNMVQPDTAYFGQKDAQQALIVRRVVRDLDIPVQIEVCPTVREPDGLALSSRNAYLSPAEREQAVALRRALDAAEAVVAAGERDADAVASAARGAMTPYGVEPEYLALVASDTLAPVDRVEGEVLVALAARVGPARLIDNTLITTPDTAMSTNGRP